MVLADVTTVSWEISWCFFSVLQTSVHGASLFLLFRSCQKSKSTKSIPIYPNQVLLFWRDPKSKCRFRTGSRKELLVSSLSIQIKFCFFWRDPKRKCRSRIGSDLGRNYVIHPYLSKSSFAFWGDPKSKCSLRKRSRKELLVSSLSIQIKFCFFGEIQKANAG